MVLTIKNFGNPVGPGIIETAPTNLVGVAGTLKATLTWISATGESGVVWTEEVLVRKEGSAPMGSLDGTVVTTITTKDTYSSTGYEDTGLDSTKTYYYKVFAVYDNGTERGSSAVNITPAGIPQTINVGGIANGGTYTNTVNATGLSKITVTSSTYIGVNNSFVIEFTNSYGKLSLSIGSQNSSYNDGLGDQVIIYNPNYTSLKNYNGKDGFNYPYSGTRADHTFAITANIANQTFNGYYNYTDNVNLADFFNADNGQLQINISNTMGGEQQNIVITLE